MTQVEVEAPAGPFVALLFAGPLVVAGALAMAWAAPLTPVLSLVAALGVAVAASVAMILFAHRARVRFGPDVLVSTVIGVGTFLGAVAILAISVPLLQTIFA